MSYLDSSLLTKVLFLLGIIVIGSFYLANKINVQKCIVVAVFFSAIFLYIEERLLPFPLQFCVKVHFRDTSLEQFYITRDIISYLKSFLFAVTITICGKLLIKGRKGIIFAVLSDVLVLIFIFSLNMIWNGFYQLIDIVDYLVYAFGIIIAVYLYKRMDYFSNLEKVIEKKPKKKIKYGF